MAELTIEQKIQVFKDIVWLEEHHVLDLEDLIEEIDRVINDEDPLYSNTWKQKG